ncbi:hypothetical protein DSECCO2_555890 [anaerobic digester metagenome]
MVFAQVPVVLKISSDVPFGIMSSVSDAVVGASLSLKSIVVFMTCPARACTGIRLRLTSSRQALAVLKRFINSTSPKINLRTAIAVSCQSFNRKTDIVAESKKSVKCSDTEIDPFSIALRKYFQVQDACRDIRLYFQI